MTDFQVAALGDGIATLHLLEIPEVEKASKRVASARKTLPEDPSLLLVEGQVALASGKMAQGIELLARAARTGKDAHSHYVLGMAYMIDESYFKAFQEFQEATRKETDFGEAWLAMGAVELQRMETHPQNQHNA